MNYFDEDAPVNCGNCDVCLSKSETFDATIIAQKALSAIVRLQERFGAGYVIDFLRGSHSEKIRDEHKALKTFGKGADISKEDWQKYINELLALGYLQKSEGQYPLLQLTTKSAAVLKGAERVMLTKSKQIIDAQEAAEPQYDTELFELLKVLRRELAAEENVPAYIVLSDATLVEIATYFPLNRGEFSNISGFGEIKLAKYGEKFWKVVADYCTAKKLQSRMHLKKMKRQRKEKPERLSDTKQQTLDLYKTGRTISQIAGLRELNVTTIETHLAYFIGTGELSIDEFVTPEKLATIERVVLEHGSKVLAPLKEILGDAYSYSEIKMTIAHLNRTEA